MGRQWNARSPRRDLPPSRTEAAAANRVAQERLQHRADAFNTKPTRRNERRLDRAMAATLGHQGYVVRHDWRKRITVSREEASTAAYNANQRFLDRAEEYYNNPTQRNEARMNKAFKDSENAEDILFGVLTRIDR